MRIQCPECSQRFDVTKDFLGKTVECGSCDHRFKVSDDEVVKEKQKFYPGEKRDASLDSFGRNAVSAGEVSFQQAHYVPEVSAQEVGPMRPRRTMAVLCGLGLVFFVVVMFLVAGGKEGALRDMETGNRFILCGFAAVLGGALIMYGYAHKKNRGVLMAVASTVVLLLMPVVFPANPVRTGDDDSFVDLPAGGSEESAKVENDRKAYLFEIGYDPVAEMLRTKRKETVVAVFVRNAPPQLRRTIGAYLYEATGKRSRETSYDRGDNDMKGLILLDDQVMTLDEIAALCARFGRIMKISRDLRLVDVMVEDSKLTQLDQYKVLDSDSLDFETQNLKALKSIDPKVRMDAVKRLAISPPRARRADITQQFVKMLPESSVELQLEIIRALKVWAQPDMGVEAEVLKVVQGLHKVGKVDKGAIEFLIQFEVEGAGVLLLELWEKDPTTWQSTMESLGAGVQVLLLPRLKELNTVLTVQAADILGKNATQPAVPLIEQAMAGKDDRAKKSLQAAIDEIKKRS